MAATEAGRYKANVAGRRGLSFPVGTGSPTNIPNCQPLQSPRYDLAFRRQLEAIHALGPLGLGYLLEEGP